jgi:periplasmic divalent cation tolerance protein
MTQKIVVFTTCGSRKEAGRIARALVELRLAACVNVLQSPVESVYRWKENVDTAKEFLLIIKTARERFPALRDKILELHSYHIPEIIAVPMAAASSEYIAWLTESVRSKPKRRKSH